MGWCKCSPSSPATPELPRGAEQPRSPTSLPLKLYPEYPDNQPHSARLSSWSAAPPPAKAAAPHAVPAPFAEWRRGLAPAPPPTAPVASPARVAAPSVTPLFLETPPYGAPPAPSPPATSEGHCALVLEPHPHPLLLRPFPLGFLSQARLMIRLRPEPLPIQHAGESPFTTRGA